MLMQSTVSLKELILLAEIKLQELNYSARSKRDAKSTWSEFERYSEQHDCTAFSELLAASFLKEKYNYPDLSAQRHSPYVNAKANAIRKLSDLQIHGRFLSNFKRKLLFITPEFQPSVDAFVFYCRKRNIVENSIWLRQKKLNDFFEHLILHGIHHPNKINAISISEYMTSLTGYSMKTAEAVVFVLRHYFRAIYYAGIMNEDLSFAVPKLHFPKQDRIPVVWNDDSIGTLLSAVDRSSPMGKRDYAILLIVIKLGLRDGDVRNLKFENIKWNSNRIEFIQSKTSQFQSLPLLSEVGNALIDYLKNGRPKSDLPYLFLKLTAPYDNIQKAGNIVTKYLRIAKIPIPKDQSHGIHSLRHSLANRLLAQEIPLDVISGILGHVTINSSKEYMHLDINNLRKCALEVGDIDG